MFRPNENKDRLDYGKLLLPPDGFRLDMAVGTTYSLDLEALAAVSICLGNGEETDSAFLQNPVNNLRAMEKISDKILIFCEAGQIKMPGAPSALTLLLEKMVNQVAIPEDKSADSYPAFHAKTWTLSYINENGEYRYRFIIMSRNLTFDRSWDVCFAMDGVPCREQPEKTKPILSFLEYLSSQIHDTQTDAAKKKIELLCGLCDRLKHVLFRLDSKEFGEEYEVLPLGIGEHTYNMAGDDLFCEEKYTARYSFHELVIFSPFLTGSIIESQNRKERSLKDCKRTLITRRSELGKLKTAQADHFDIYVLKDELIDGEEYLFDADKSKQKQDIHAKIFLRRKDSNTSLYLGSMNATYSAIHKNVEMMIRLRTKKSYLDGEKFLEEIFCGPADGKNNPFMKAEIPEQIPDPEEDRKQVLERKIKKLCRQEIKASVTETGDGRYQVSVQFEKAVRDENLLLSPLRSAQKESLKEQILFEDLELLQISEFYEVIAFDGEIELHRVIRIPTTGIPETRDSAIVNSVVKDRETFVEYVALVLGEDHLTTLMEQKQMEESGFFRHSKNAMPALYEKMLRVALHEKERLKEIDVLLKMITDEAIIPKDFRETYETFCRTVKLD